MNNLSIEDRVWIITSSKIFDSPTLVKRQWKRERPNSKPPTDKTIRLIMEKFKKGHIATIKPPGLSKSVVTENNVRRAPDLIAEEPSRSVRKGCQELGVSCHV